MQTKVVFCDASLGACDICSQLSSCDIGLKRIECPHPILEEIRLNGNLIAAKCVACGVKISSKAYLDLVKQ